ncbi:MAG: Ycf51 family protein [Thermosynechococcaceae cyanobacterium]
MTNSVFILYCQWSAIATVAFALFAGLAFLLKWGFRFRLVGITGFMGVLTVGLFALSIVPLTRTSVPGAVRYSVVYDSASTQAVIVVPSNITKPQMEATLQQAAGDLFSPGRSGIGQLTIRARALAHPGPGVSEIVPLGQVQRSLAVRDDENMTIEVYETNLAQLSTASDAS